MQTFEERFTDLLESSTVDKNYKRIALCLYSLSKKDRQWLLANLEEPHRDKITAYIQSLQKLGIQPVPSIAEAVLKHSALNNLVEDSSVWSRAFANSDAAMIAMSLLADDEKRLNKIDLSNFDRQCILGLLDYWQATMPVSLLECVNQLCVVGFEQGMADESL